MSKKTISVFQKLKNNNEKIAMLTAYDYSTAKVLGDASVDAILVGDSLAMVALGYEDTYNISVDEMLIFIKAVARGAKNSFIIGDMPFMSYNVSVEQGLENAGKMIKAGANAVKIEGCNEYILEVIKRCVSSGIPVLGHLGLTPQYINMIGGHKIQGKTNEQIEKLTECARQLQEAGVFAVVLELVTSEGADYITKNLSIPTIGIGSGANCDGQIVVTDDIIGKYTDFTPKFIKKYANIHDIVLDGVNEYIKEVKMELFPASEQTFTIEKEEKDRFATNVSK